MYHWHHKEYLDNSLTCVKRFHSYGITKTPFWPQETQCPSAGSRHQDHNLNTLNKNEVIKIIQCIIKLCTNVQFMKVRKSLEMHMIPCCRQTFTNKQVMKMTQPPTTGIQGDLESMVAYWFIRCWTYDLRIAGLVPAWVIMLCPSARCFISIVDSPKG